MLVPFEQMPDQSRLWIYQVNRPLSNDEITQVKAHTEKFLSAWQAHGQDLKASYKVEHSQFLIISVDESFSQASGCSIDSSVHLIQELERALNVSFMTTSQVAFLMENRISLIPFNDLRGKVDSNVIGKQTKVFDNTVKNLHEFRTRWLIPSEQSWVNRFFK